MYKKQLQEIMQSNRVIPMKLVDLSFIYGNIELKIDDIRKNRESTNLHEYTEQEYISFLHEIIHERDELLQQMFPKDILGKY